MKIINLKTTNKLEAINQTIKVLESGGLVIYPTETCYGAGVDATNENAVKKLLQFKGARSSNISIAVSNISMAKKYVHINSVAHNLYTNFLPGPITVISKSLGKTAPQFNLTGQTLGIRIPNHPFTLELIKRFNSPLTATSANTSGQKQPYSLKDLKKYTSRKKLEMIDLFLDAGKLQERPASTVVDTTMQDIKIIRQGAISIDNTNSFTSNSETETRQIAEKLLTQYLPILKSHPLIIALQGDLGTGKTVIAKGLAQALNITDTITSPTYTIIKEYPYQVQKLSGILFHLDTWRLEQEDKTIELNLTPMLAPKNIIVIEWMQKIKPLLDKLQPQLPILWITIDQPDQNTRIIKHKLRHEK